jgi:hypothetical protein
MSRERIRPPSYETVNLWGFALPGLSEFRTKTHVAGMLVGRDDAASAAIWVAAQLPPEVCKAMVESYIAAEKKTHDAIIEGLTAFFGR